MDTVAILQRLQFTLFLTCWMCLSRTRLASNALTVDFSGDDGSTDTEPFVPFASIAST